MKTILATAACGLALGLASPAAALVINFDSTPLGAYAPDFYAAQPISVAPNPGRAFIVDLGGGDRALQINQLPATGIPQLKFFNRAEVPHPTTLFPTQDNVYRLISLDVMSPTGAGFSGSTGVSGFAPPGQWVTWTISDLDRAYLGNPSAVNIGTITLQFGGSTIYVDNIVYEFLGTTAVAEPSTWAMLIAGFGLIGASLRRRRAVVLAA